MIPFSEKLATLVVDGVETEINAAVYGDNAVLVLTDAFEKSPSDFTGRGGSPIERRSSSETEGFRRT